MTALKYYRPHVAEGKNKTLTPPQKKKKKKVAASALGVFVKRRWGLMNSILEVQQY